MMKRKNAFTLIELLVVISIMMLLAIIAVVAAINIPRRAARAKQLEFIHRIEVALEEYHAEFHGYPPPAGESSRPLFDYLGQKLEVRDTITGRVQKTIPALIAFKRSEVAANSELLDVNKRPMRYRNPGRDHTAERGGRDNSRFVDIWCQEGAEWGNQGPPANWKTQ